jgi:hypothetical protein
MSEPYSLIISLPVGAPALRQALGQASQPASSFDDWNLLGFDVEAVHLERAAPTRGWTPRRYLGELRGDAREEMGWMFRYDEGAGRLTCIVALWTQNLGEIIGGLAVLRTLVQAADRNAGDPGHILVHDYVFEAAGSAGAVVGGNGTTQIVAGTSSLILPFVAAAKPLLQGMIEVAGDVFEGDLTRDPDALLIDHFAHWG